MNITNPTALTHSQSVHGKSTDSPAFKARATIEGNAGLGSKSFGEIVSKIARGLPVEPETPVQETSQPSPDTSEGVIV